ncbi:carboxymuconolactone decarboxylase family protein [Gallaecimonas pentaromativorans]|uniref:carboxymuconolactone decarboxylase family protein n=1 Tax=Gallaecimonas pentaromativorans TaxID=584787 RepID=UPI003A917B67
MLAADNVLAKGNLSNKDQEAIKVLVSELTCCDYCLAAQLMIGKSVGHKAETLKALRAGQSTGDAKLDALAHFVRQLQQNAGTLAQAEVDAIRAAGYSDTQLVDICLGIAVITFTNLFNRINDTVLDFPAAD